MTLTQSRNTPHKEYSAGSVAVNYFTAEYGPKYSERRYYFLTKNSLASAITNQMEQVFIRFIIKVV